MFSCCALFSSEDLAGDTEHLKALDEVDATRDGDISISVEAVGMDGSTGGFEGTPLVTSPRLAAAQHRSLEALSSSEMPEAGAVQGLSSTSQSAADERAAAEASAQQATREAELGVVTAAEARAVAQAAADTASAERTEQTLRHLREAEDAAHSAAAEAEKRRFEEEASARAARKAESEARKALWRAEEAQKVRELAGSKAAAEKAAAVHRVAKEEAEIARRQAATARMEKARDHVAALLTSEQGLRLQKHGRNGKTMNRTLTAPNRECQTLTWGKTLHDLGAMQEVRRGTDADPAYPGFTGTTALRRSKVALGAMDRSFSLLFPSRSLDFTVSTKDECEELVLGFQALVASQRS